MLPMEVLKEIRAVFERCQGRYPTIDLPFESFYERLAEILSAVHEVHAAGGFPACSDCLSALGQICHEDLFLTTACVRGDRIAWEHFADQYMPLLKRFATQACRNCGEGEDLAQEIITVLLGESHGASPATHQVNGQAPASVTPRGKLHGYCGRGSLAGWLRAAVAHAAIDRFRRARKQVSLDEMAEKAGSQCTSISGPTGAAEERLDARWGPVLASFVRKEIEHLSARDRLILGLYYLEGVPLKTIGLRFGASEATASRWLERVRRKIRKNVERELNRTHGLHGRELESLWRWVAESTDPKFETSLKSSSASMSMQKKLQGGIV